MRFTTHPLAGRPARVFAATLALVQLVHAALVAGQGPIGQTAPAAARAPAVQPVHAVSLHGQYTVTGNVRGADESRLFGAHVTLTRSDVDPTARVDAMTDVDGAFRFENIGEGEARLVIRRLGFRPDTLSVEVPQLAGGAVVVLLQRVAEPLAPVFVRETGGHRPGPLPSAFERRRSSGFGHFFTRADIEHRAPQHTSDLFRSLPGVTMSTNATGSLSPHFRTTGRVGLCDPLYWMDGSPLASSTLDLDALNPRAIESIEVYSGNATVPPALRGTTAAGGCGVIAIWTRHGELQQDDVPDAVAADSLDAMVQRGWVFTADQVELAAAPLPGLGPMPAYPDSLRAANVPGRVVAEFVVDGQGKVDPDAIGIVSSTHPLFAEAVRAAVVDARFSPAYREGHVVRQVVHLPVVFDPDSPTHKAP